MFILKADGDLEELYARDERKDDDVVVRDGKRVRVNLSMMDADSPQAKQNAAYEAMCKRTAEAWRNPTGAAATPTAQPIVGTENYVGSGGRKGYIERTANAWRAPTVIAKK